MKRNFLGLGSKDKMIIALISTSKEMTGRYPTKEELDKGLKTLNIELTDVERSRLKEAFPELD